MIDRRNFLGLLTAGAAGTLWSGPAGAAAAPFDVVVVGGGMAGATAAKYLRMWSGGTARVTLIDANPAYVSNIMSNRVVTGEIALRSLTYSYTALTRNHGVRFVNASVSAVDVANRRVVCANGAIYPYDRLVLAPGIDFDYSGIPGMDAAAQAAIPHAWKAGPQTSQLAAQLRAMPASGGVFVLTIPAKPYRCPPGPYERACAVADWLQRNRRASKLIVLDGNAPTGADPYSALQAEPVNFKNAFAVRYAGIVEYHPGVTINSVNAPRKTLSVTYDGASHDIPYHVLNIIPPQKAGSIIQTAGLANGTGGRWAKVNLLSYQSTAAGAERIHVIGDSHESKQPKAGHIGNQEAKICADAILRLQAGSTPYAKPITNSACYTPITATTATWLTAVFGYDAATGDMAIINRDAQGLNKPVEPLGGPTTEAYEQMLKWFAALMGDTFA